VLAEPFEILELQDGQSVRLKVVRSEEGEMLIHPRYAGAPAEKRIPALRLFLPEGFKPHGANYWDLTSKTLQAQLRPLLPDVIASKRDLVITAHGSGPSKRFSVRLE
jgi:hypothetical protein